MSERNTPEHTIAEIIGKTSDGAWPHDGRLISASLDEVWKWRCGACGEWVDEAGCPDAVPPCPIDWRNAAPSVDDMLAWLVEVDRFIALTKVKGTEAMVEVVLGNTTRYYGTKRGATLHEALCAAVRAVAGSSEEQT